MEDRQSHNRYQEELFREAIDHFREPIPAEVIPRLERIVELAVLQSSDRVLDVGTGRGVLVPYIRKYGVREIVGCDLSAVMLKDAGKLHPDVTFWNGDVADLPDSYGAFDAIFFNAMFGNVWDQERTLDKAASLCGPGGRICISHPLGSRFVAQLHEEDPRCTPHLLPERDRLRGMAASLGLAVAYFEDSPEFYAAVLRKE